MAEPLFPDRALQEAYQALTKGRPGAEHVDEHTWDQIVGEEIDPAARDAAFDHVIQCEDCSRVWRGVLTLRSEAETQGLIAPAAPAAAPFWRSRLVPLAAAAALVIAVAGLLISRAPAPDADTVRSAAALPPIDGLMMAIDPEGVPTFVWPPFATAERYRVEVFSEDGRPVWSGEVATPPARWPAGVPRAKGTYRWRVEAVSGDVPVARSRLTPMGIVR
jgi:hypothetical protein